MTKEKTITMRCKPFAGFPVGSHRVRVDADGAVRVYDAIAGHYTTCHSLAKSAIARARKMAARGEEND